MPSKISIIGAGNVGATCAQRIVERGYADVVLVDIVEGLPQGKALDILVSDAILNFNSRIVGTNGYEDTADSDVVIFTAGFSRKPGMTRDELLMANSAVITGVIPNVVKYSPNCIIIMITNPVDAMTYLALHVSQFPRDRLFGLSGVLDIARFRSLIAAELKVPVASISGCILGQHGENMVVIPRLTTVEGEPLTKLLPQEIIDKLVERTVNAGAEIVKLLKTGSAFYAPSAGVAQMAEAIVLDTKEVLHCAALLDGEYGIKDSVIGVPVELGKGGIEQIIELELTTEEKQALNKSAEAVKELIVKVKLR
jgi:malate dehydrogenase